MFLEKKTRKITKGKNLALNFLERILKKILWKQDSRKKRFFEKNIFLDLDLVSNNHFQDIKENT
jgi:hypothetical protein